MKKQKTLDKIIQDIASLEERLSPVTDMTAVGEFTTKKIREHLRTLTAIVGELAIDVRSMQEGK